MDDGERETSVAMALSTTRSTTNVTVAVRLLPVSGLGKGGVFSGFCAFCFFKYVIIYYPTL